MTIPTRFMDQKEFDKMYRAVDGVVPAFKLAAHGFNPPRPDEEMLEETAPAVRVLMLDVDEPRLYRDNDGAVFVVLNPKNILTYEQAQDSHPTKGAWYYQLSPYLTDKANRLADSIYVFAEDVPAYEADKIYTH